MRLEIGLMKWEKVSNYGMVREPYRVSKNAVQGQLIYVLWFNHEKLGQFATFELCQAAADAHKAAPALTG